jgi:uncharacterized protein YwgA
MAIENWRWLTAVIAAHPNHEVFGRTRLQKTVWLLQRLGMPTDYAYSLHFYGPYSEDVKADIALVERIGLITETPKDAQDGTEYFLLTANPSKELPDLGKLKQPLALLAAEDSTVLELAATYDAFREMGLSPESALQSLRAKKGDKCSGGRETRALDIVRRLGLEAAAA